MSEKLKTPFQWQEQRYKTRFSLLQWHQDWTPIDIPLSSQTTMASTHGRKFAIAPSFYWANKAEREPCVVTHILASTLQSSFSAMIESNAAALRWPFPHYPIPNHSPEWQSWGWWECSIPVCEDVVRLACSSLTYQASSLVLFSFTFSNISYKDSSRRLWTFPKTNVKTNWITTYWENCNSTIPNKINYYTSRVCYHIIFIIVMFFQGSGNQDPSDVYQFLYPKICPGEGEHVLSLILWLC